MNKKTIGIIVALIIVAMLGVWCAVNANGITDTLNFNKTFVTYRCLRRCSGLDCFCRVLWYCKDLGRKFSGYGVYPCKPTD